MIYTLRHLTIRLWVSLMAGSLIVILVFPVFSGQLGLSTIFWGAFFCFLIFFFISGWITDTVGMRWVNSLIREAGIWERAGNFRQSENIFQKAVSIFDSFLISPVAREEKSRELTARMARFYLAPQEKNQASEAFIISYLDTHPEDGEVTESWLQKTEKQEKFLKDYDELAFKMGNAQPENTGLQVLLARSYLLSERSDFPALKTYRRIIEDETVDDRKIIHGIAVRFFKDGRTDRWAMKAYLKAFKSDRKMTWLLKGIAACMHGSRVNDRSSPVYEEAGSLLSRLDETTLKKMREGFTPPAPSPTQPAAHRKVDLFKALVRAWVNSASTLVTGAGTMFRSIRTGYVELYYRIKNYKNTKLILKWTIVGLAGAGLVVLVVNTAGYLIKSRETTQMKTKPPAEVVITDLFTLQVAAYLKVEHAEKFVDTLKKMDLDAYFTEAQGAKTKWYQVRISHFPTKDAARSYGESLKAKGIIDDFYVANYIRP